jgi:hypothetical protein
VGARKALGRFERRTSVAHACFEAGFGGGEGRHWSISRNTDDRQPTLDQLVRFRSAAVLGVTLDQERKIRIMDR